MRDTAFRCPCGIAGWGGMLRPPPARHQASAALSSAGTGRRNAVHSAFRSPFRVLGGAWPLTARFFTALRSGEHAGEEVAREMVAMLTASWMATADLGYRHRLA